MRITKIKIHNLLGHEDLEFSPKGFNLITGKNGTGKSTVLKAIYAALGGKSKLEQAQLLRKGATEGEVVLLLDDTLKVTRKIDNEGKNTLAVVDTETRGRFGQELLDKMIDALAFNPVKFLTAADKDRTRLMLEALPVDLDRSDLDKALGGLKCRTIPDTGHALVLIDAADAEIREQRKGLKRDLETKRKTAQGLFDSLPPLSADLPWDDKVTAIEGQIKELEGKVTAAETKAAGELANAKTANIEGYTAAMNRAAAQRDGKVKAAEAKIAAAQQEINDAKAEYNVLIEQCENAKNSLNTESEKHINATLEECRTPIRAQLKTLAGDLADAKAHRDEEIRAGATQKLYDETRKEADLLEEGVAARQAAVERLDALKKRLTTNLPIAGLEVNNGAISVDGIAFDMLNTAKQVQLAFDIAILRHGSMKGETCDFIACDGLEALDADTMAEFERAAEASGMQVIAARVSETPFHIEAR